jgi:hypothetical protein
LRFDDARPWHAARSPRLSRTEGARSARQRAQPIAFGSLHRPFAMQTAPSHGAEIGIHAFRSTSLDQTRL